jgi:short-subunit dehydrogenase
MNTKYGPWALVIGGSEGIGRSLVEKLAAQGLNIAFTARKVAPLMETTAAVTAAHPNIQVRSLSQDITASNMMERIEDFTKDLDIGLLIYNAGAMNRVPEFLDDTIDGHLHTLRLNCEGPTRLCHHFGRKMRDRGGGGIMLMSSVSALIGSWGTAVYGGTKAFDLMLCESLWYELKPHNIDVLCLVIGGTRTPSHERLMPGRNKVADDPADVAQQGLENIDKGPVVYVRSIQPQLDMFFNRDRTSAVQAFGDYARGFFLPQPDLQDANVRPFDPLEVVR